MTFFERLAALGWFLLAAAWFLFSDLVAMRAASGLNFGDWYEPLYRVFLLFLLVLGYSLMSLLTRRGVPPRKGIGLDPRPGCRGEFGLGAALGWGGVVACVLPAALVGGLVFTVFGNSHQFLVAALDLIALAAGTLAIEVAFRGYAFRRLVEAMGPGMATLFLAAIYAIWRTHLTPTTTAAVVVSFLLGWILALAALRTRALWVSWGFSFAWSAAMSLLFGLPIAGGMNYSPIFVANTLGPAWVSGGAQGPEGSGFGVLVAFLLLIVMVRATSDLHYKYAFSEVLPGGIPVDIDAAARQQHEAAMGPAQPAEPQLVQILPATANPTPAAQDEAAANEAGPEIRGSEENPGPEPN
ncbi:MAG TPA: CPBP family intramembrane glutamic endopeptidase [Acidobacteriaceae bacterium]|nr:CPBP family intramembrane glutamic endopeptidase [Acidobacteriaceae bacterium]